MSDTTKLILAIVVAVIVVAVIISLVLNARKRRETEHRRFEAGELRAKIEQQAPVLRQNDDRASVTGEIAASARSEAHAAAEAAERKAREARALEEQAAQKDEEARRLEKHAEGHASAAEEARASAAALAREADRLDPDVRTDEEGNRLDAADAADAAGAGGATDAGGSGQASRPEESAAAPFLRDDDEPDLADADNPFAVSEEGMGTNTSSNHPTDESRDDVSNDDTTTPDTTSADTSGHGSSSRTPDTATGESSWEGSSATGAAAAAGAGAAEGWASRGDDDDETEAAPDAADLRSESSRESADAEQTPEDRSGDSSSMALDDDQQVSVPALDDRDEVVTGSGTPADDPGDHRGQPWATTTGEQPPGADTEEGADTHTEPTDPTAPSEPTEPTEPEDGGQQAVGPSGSGDDVSDETAAHDTSSSAGRRVSGLEEVRDGGYGVGSAAPFDDGAQPLGHEIKASRDGGTFRAPGDEGYDDHEPDVWFYDEDSARRAGFRRHGE